MNNPNISNAPPAPAWDLILEYLVDQMDLARCPICDDLPDHRFDGHYVSLGCQCMQTKPAYTLKDAVFRWKDFSDLRVVEDVPDPEAESE